SGGNRQGRVRPLFDRSRHLLGHGLGAGAEVADLVHDAFRTLMHAVSSLTAVIGRAGLGHDTPRVTVALAKRCTPWSVPQWRGSEMAGVRPLAKTVRFLRRSRQGV